MKVSVYDSLNISPLELQILGPGKTLSTVCEAAFLGSLVG
jgi:hypothetical protein